MYCSLPASAAFSQRKSSIPASTTPQLHYDFPFQTMWDDAVIASRTIHKPTLAFDLDLIDSNSIQVANVIVADKDLQSYIREHFEPALNDFAIDPPVTVGLDSLRNLGQRLSGLEKNYRIPIRPTLILIDCTGQEMERILNAQRLSGPQLRSRLEEILAGRNTMASAIRDFWRDTTSIVLRQNLINMFEERSNYDSVIKHVAALRLVTAYPAVARSAQIRYSYLKLEVEGDASAYRELIGSLSRHGEDSALAYDAYQQLIAYYTKRKKADSAAAYYDRIMEFTDTRDPDLLNDYAWELANYSKHWAKAKSLIDEAISKKATDANYYDTRALVYGLMANADSAILDEKKAVALATSTDDQTEFTNKLHYYQTRKEQAAKLLEEESQGDANASSQAGLNGQAPVNSQKHLKQKSATPKQR